LSLSKARARSVRDWLVSHQVLPYGSEIVGFGKSMPVAPNVFDDGSDNPEGRQKNRPRGNHHRDLQRLTHGCPCLGDGLELPSSEALLLPVTPECHQPQTLVRLMSRNCLSERAANGWATARRHRSTQLFDGCRPKNVSKLRWEVSMTAWVRLATLSFRRISLTCALTVVSPTPSS
jgi:hypothetical protein